MLAGSEIKSMSATERLQAKELLLRSFLVWKMSFPLLIGTVKCFPRDWQK